MAKSIIFGVLKSAGSLATERELYGLAGATERYATDEVCVHANGRVGMGFQPYHTHKRSSLESQPVSGRYGDMLTFDGRLDNYRDLARILDIQCPEIADSKLVLAAFERWGNECFSRLIGDWALALWCHSEQSLYLARDHAGSRMLYFEQTDGCVRWATSLETFFAEGKTRNLSADFAARYLAGRAIHDLTPYREIKAVTPAHYFTICNGKLKCNAHWDPAAESHISYRDEREYDEQFLHLFEQSVSRRTGPGSPIIAHLSGGMDSTSIVCMSDSIKTRKERNPNLLDTLSYFDDSEPHWDEKAFFTIVEKGRGKMGIHVPTSFLNMSMEPHNTAAGSYHYPGPDSTTLRREQHLQRILAPGNYRVVLSGIGGDELLGGIPASYPELADCLVSGQVPRLLRRATDWSLALRRTLWDTLADTVMSTLHLYGGSNGEQAQVPPWLSPNLQRCCDPSLLQGQPFRLSRLSMMPSTISKGLAWWSILETQHHRSPELLSRYEYRYPYLDRDLVDFLLRIPRSQLVEPGRRRVLMRRALTGIVPPEILERRRKAYLSRGPLLVLQAKKKQITELIENSIAADLSLIVPDILLSAINNMDSRLAAAVLRSIALELWLRSNSNLIAKPDVENRHSSSLPPRSGGDRIRVQRAVG